MEEECIICFEPLKFNIVILSCSHKNHYHYKCLEDWIKQRDTLTKICTICDIDVEILNIKNIKELKKKKKFLCC